MLWQPLDGFQTECIESKEGLDLQTPKLHPISAMHHKVETFVFRLPLDLKPLLAHGSEVVTQVKSNWKTLQLHATC